MTETTLFYGWHMAVQIREDFFQLPLQLSMTTYVHSVHGLGVEVTCATSGFCL